MDRIVDVTGMPDDSAIITIALKPSQALRAEFKPDHEVTIRPARLDSRGFSARFDYA